MLSYHLIVPTLPFYCFIVSSVRNTADVSNPSVATVASDQAPLGCRGQLHAVWLPVPRGLMLLSAAPPGPDFTFNLENKISTSKYDTNNINKILYNSATLDFNINFYTV